MDHEGVFFGIFGKCRMSRASRVFAPWTPVSTLPWNRWGAQSTPQTPSCREQWPLVIAYTSCDLQTTDSGKNIPILMGKLREKWVEIIKNSGKMMLKILYEPWYALNVKTNISWYGPRARLIRAYHCFLRLFQYNISSQLPWSSSIC